MALRGKSCGPFPTPALAVRSSVLHASASSGPLRPRRRYISRLHRSHNYMKHATNQIQRRARKLDYAAPDDEDSATSVVGAINNRDGRQHRAGLHTLRPPVSNPQGARRYFISIVAFPGMMVMVSGLQGGPLSGRMKTLRTEFQAGVANRRCRSRHGPGSGIELSCQPRRGELTINFPILGIITVEVSLKH